MKETHQQKAKKIIAENIYMTVAVASPDGIPWIFSVLYAYDRKYNFYWVSDKNSRHSKMIQENPKCALAIFDSTAPEGEGDGIFIEAQAKELLSEKEIADTVETVNARRTKDIFRIKTIDQVTGESVKSIYSAIPTHIYGLTDGRFLNGQYIDQRIEIDLK